MVRKMIIEPEPLTPARLQHELDDIAGLADALAIIASQEDERASRAVASLANQISQRLEALYGEVHEARNDPESFMGSGKRKTR
jgi:hypothetical protein